MIYTLSHVCMELMGHRQILTEASVAGSERLRFGGILGRIASNPCMHDDERGKKVAGNPGIRKESSVDLA